VVGDVASTRVIVAVTIAVGIASGFWNSDLAGLSWSIRLVVVVAGGAFSIEAARARERSRKTLRRQRLLAAAAELPAPGASLEDTVRAVIELFVPRHAEFAAIDARRGDDLTRLAAEGPERAELDGAKLQTPLRARGRELGVLTLATLSSRPFTADEREFMGVLGGRVALTLDNAGLSQELVTAEQRLQAILANLAEAVTVQDRSGRLVFANEAAARLLGAAGVEDLLNTPPMEFFERFDSYNEDGTPLRVDQLPGRSVLAGKQVEPLVVRSVNRTTGEARWRLTKATPVMGPDGEVALAVNIIEDITEAKRQEQSQRLLADASGVLASSLDYEQTLQRVAELLVPELADWCSVSIPRAGTLETVAVFHSDPAMVEWARRYEERYPARLDDPEGVAEVIRSGRSQLIPEVTDEMLEAATLDAKQRELIRELGMNSVLIVPMGAGERIVGAITLVSAESRRRFSEADLGLAEELGRRAGTALENSRLYTELGQVTQTLQRGLLPPPLPDVPGWSFRSLYMPAAGQIDVGGDFYDVFPTAAGWMAVIGDVVGRGAEAASLTAMARYTLRTAGSLVGTPTMGLARLNENLRERGDMALCTAAVVLLRAEGGDASVVSAGHPLPLLIRGGRAEPVGRGGPLLGAFDHGHWLPAAVELRGGDVLVMFTDGVTDARSTNGRGRFGEERLLETLEGAANVDDAIERIRAALERFAGAEQSDDTAVLALQRVGAP
jgi:PAS domain S-box-containing protein